MEIKEDLEELRLEGGRKMGDQEEVRKEGGSKVADEGRGRRNDSQFNGGRRQDDKGGSVKNGR